MEKIPSNDGSVSQLFLSISSLRDKLRHITVGDLTRVAAEFSDTGFDFQVITLHSLIESFLC